MKRIIFALVLAATTAVALAQATIYDTIAQRVAEREWQAYTSPRHGFPAFAVTLPQADGSYADVPYDNRGIVNWLPIQHLQRVLAMAVAYTCPAHPQHADQKLFTSICNALAYWHKAHPVSSNWWWNQISAPQELGKILVVMRSGRERVPAGLERSMLERMHSEAGNPEKWTGANKSDIATHWIYQAVLERDSAKLDFAVHEAFMPIELSTKEGAPQHDYSFQQHGPQLYIGGYGDVFLFNAVTTAQLTRGTRLALSPSRLRLVRRFATESFFPIIRGSKRNYNTQGRSFTRSNGIDMADSVGNIVKILRQVDPQHAATYDTVAARLSGQRDASYGLHPYHRHYFRTDYTLHQRPGYTFDVRLKSAYIKTNESGNGENLLGYFLSDGGTCLAMSGNEYHGIFPVWDWRHIPGTTAPELDSLPTHDKWYDPLGTSHFAGGASDGYSGVTAYAYADSDKIVKTEARKGWFFFDDAVVCLGAGISSQADAPVYTTIEQNNLRGDIMLSDKKGSLRHPLANEGLARLDAGKHLWVWHGGCGYYLPNGGNISVGWRRQTGSWWKINHSQRADSVVRQVFNLYIDHGQRPQAATYAYIVVPACKPQEQDAAQKYRILRNDTLAQIVRCGRNGAIGLIAYKAGRYKADKLSINVSRPCVIFMRPQGDGWLIATADPSRKLSNVTVSLNLGKPLGQHTLNVAFRPSPDPYAGGSVLAHIGSDTPQTVTAKFDTTPWQYE